MPGTVLGGKQAAKTNKKLYGKDFYANIGRIGGARSNNGGFASKLIGEDGLTGRERAKKVGHVGGKLSKRPKKAVLDAK